MADNAVRRRLRAVLSAVASSGASASRTEGSPLRWDEASEEWRPKSPDDPESDEEDDISRRLG